MTVTSPMPAEDIRRWIDEVQLIARSRHGFGQLVIVADDGLPPPAAQQAIGPLLALLREWGLIRSAVIFHDPRVGLRFKQLAWASGVHEFERYISGEREDWELAAMAWIVDGREPDG